MSRKNIKITAGGEAVAATVTEAKPENMVSATAAAGEIVQLTGPEVINKYIDAQKQEVLQEMHALSSKGFLRGLEDPAYRGMRKVADHKEGELLWLGRWFQFFGGTYHPIVVKVLPQGSIVAQAHQVVSQRDRSTGEPLKDSLNRTLTRTIQSIMFENTEQEAAFNKVVDVLPEYLLALGVI